MGKPALKEMGMLLIFVAALVGLSSAGTCPATATAAVCVDGCRPAGVACSETTDTAGFRVMTLTGTQDWSGVTAEYENVLIRIVLTGQQTATFGATTSLSFNVPLTTQFGAAFNLIFVDGVATGSGTGTVVSLGGTINLRVGRIVPESVPLFRFPNADANGANWRGLFGAVTNTNPDQCLVTTSTPVYTSNTVAVTLGVRQNPRPLTASRVPLLVRVDSREVPLLVSSLDPSLERPCWCCWPSFCSASSTLTRSASSFRARRFMRPRAVFPCKRIEEGKKEQLFIIEK